MAIGRTIDNYNDGATGQVYSNGYVVGYSIESTAGTSTYSGTTGAVTGDFLQTDISSGSATSTATFDQQVTGVEITVNWMNADNPVIISIDGNVVNLQDLISDGQATFNPGGDQFINASGEIESSTNNGHGGEWGTLTLNVPLTSVSITHEVNSGSRDSNYYDIGLTDDVSVSPIPCFIVGTLIETQNGPVPVETLKTGDMIRTKDHGFQPVRWVGGSRVHDAPVRIKAGTFGNARDLVVSPRHRMLLQGWQMGLLFNHDEAFAAAKDMQNGTTITMEPEGWVTYYHVLLDRHEVIYAEGAETESFFPDEASLNSMAKSTRAELAQTVDLSTFGRTVRPTLTANQAMYLSHNMDLLEDEQGGALQTAVA